MVKPASPPVARHDLLIRINKLQVTAMSFGAVNSLVEQAAYRVLEAECSRSRAVGRYVRFAVRQWIIRAPHQVRSYARYWWFRYVRFWPVDRINARLDQDFERDMKALLKKEGSDA